MAAEEKPDIQYLTKRCRLRHRNVWAIIVKQAGGQVQVANCLDKDKPCYGLRCAFTVKDGKWPFPNDKAASFYLTDEEIA